MCSKAGAFMENFEREGLSEAHLQELSRVDVDKIEADIREAEIERDRILRPADAAYELECNKIREEHQTRLRAAEKAYDAAVTAEKDEKQRLKDEYAEAEKKNIKNSENREKTTSRRSARLNGPPTTRISRLMPRRSSTTPKSSPRSKR